MRHSQSWFIHTLGVVIFVTSVTNIFATTTVFSDCSNGCSKISTSGFSESYEKQTQTADLGFTKSTNYMSNLSTMTQEVQTVTPTSNKNMALDEYCFHDGSCEIPPERKLKHCSCDTQCEDYNFCCLDHYRTNNDVVKSQYECQTLSNGKNAFRGFFAIAVCPDDYDNETMKEKCSQGTTVEEITPVVQNKSKIFKNKYCALCHNVIDFTGFDVKFYNLKMNDEEFENFTKLARIPKMNFVFQRADYELVPPVGTELMSCMSRLSENDNPLCKLFINPVFRRFRRIYYMYRNYNCVPSEEKPFISCIGGYNHRFVNNIQKLSVIFAFTEAQSVSDQAECLEWSEEVEKSSRCLDIETYTNVILHVEYYMVSTLNHTKSELIMISLLSTWVNDLANLTNMIWVIEVQLYENAIGARVRLRIKIVKRCFVHELDRLKKNIKERKMRIILNDNMTTEAIYIDRVNTLPSELRNVPTAGRRKRFYNIGASFNATKLLMKNKIDILKHNIHTFCGDATIEVSRTTENTLYVQSVHCNHDNIAMQTNSSGSVLPIITYLCFSMSIAVLIGLLI